MQNKLFKDAYAKSLDKLGMNAYAQQDDNGKIKYFMADMEADKQNSYEQPQQQNMQQGGEVVAGPMDAPGAAGGVDTVQRNLTPADPASGQAGEVVVDQSTVEALGGPQVLEQLSGLVKQLASTGKDPTLVGQAIQGAIEQIVQQDMADQAKVANEGMTPGAPVSPPVSPEAQPGMAGPVGLPQGTGQARPNPVL